MEPLRISDVRRPFTSETFARRLIRTLALEPGAQVLELFAGSDGLAPRLTKEAGVDVVVAEADDAALDAARGAMRAQGNPGRSEFRKIDLEKPSLPEGEFAAVIVHASDKVPPRRIAERFGRTAAFHGRLCGVAVVRVGRYPNPQVVEAWEAKVGEPLALPRELLATLDGAGFEPETSESLSDLELEALYRGVEAQPLTEPMRQEIAHHRGQGGKSSVSFAFFVGRRREPNERPAAARTRG
jgi:hypothetical protein